MDAISWIFIIILGIGVIVAAILGIGLLIAAWWLIIPAVCALIGGWVGFFFGLGLDAIIGFIILAVQGASSNKNS